MAFGYGKPSEAETILVFDLGGGTYDVSILDSFEGIMEVRLPTTPAAGRECMHGCPERSPRAPRAANVAHLRARRSAAPPAPERQPPASPSRPPARPARGRARTLERCWHAPAQRRPHPWLPGHPCNQVLGTGGDAQLGGDDFDQALAALLLRRLAAAAPPGAAAALASDPSNAAALLAAAEGAKVALSGADDAPVAVSLASPGGAPPVTLDTRLTRRELLEATAELRGRLWAPLAGAAADCKLELAGSGSAFESALTRQLAGVGAGSSRRDVPSRPSSSAAAAAVPAVAAAAAAGGDRFAPKPRRATAAVLVGGATRMPVIRDYVAHVTGLVPRCAGG